MKKQAWIFIDIDTDSDTSSRTEDHTDKIKKLGSDSVQVSINGFALPATNMDTTHIFRIVVGKSQQDSGYKFEPPNVLAHELGHAIGMVLGTPGWAQDPRRFAHLSSAEIYTTPQFVKGMIASEQEAWQFAAEMVRPDSKFDADRAAGVKSYIDTLREAEGSKAA